MAPRFHRRVQVDLNEAISHYYSISDELGDDFFAEFRIGVAKVIGQPRLYHFDGSGLRRFSLDRFPYHFLYDIRVSSLRVWVLRHDSRRPSYGTQRFNS